MPRKLTSASARKWAGYNRRRAKDRASRQDPDVRFLETLDAAKAA